MVSCRNRIRNLLYVATIQCLFNSNLFAVVVSGQVSDFVTDAPLSQVNVIITSTEYAIRDTVVTNSNGQWFWESDNQSIEPVTILQEFNVSQNFPNPFNPSTSINFNMVKAGLVELAVYNILGQEIDSKRQFLNPGNYRIDWNSDGPAGVYFYTLKTSEKSITKKMIQLDGGYHGGLSEIYGSTLHTTQPLAKPAEIPISLTFEKFAYISDTTTVNLISDEYVETTLETIHNSLTLIDLHNDLLEQMLNDTEYHWEIEHSYHHTDIPRLIKGGVDIQFFAIWVNPNDDNYVNNPFQISLSALDLFNRELNLNPDYIQQATTYAEAISINTDGKIAAVLGVEGGHTIENSIDNLITLYNAGARYMTITWNNSTDWAISAKDPRTNIAGLTDFGFDVIRAMDSLGMIIDISHVGIKTVDDILNTTDNPIVATHSGARAVCDHYRNLNDDQIEAIAYGGGVVGIVFYPYFISGSRSASISQVIDHIDHIVNLVGIEHVAIGSDFDGIEVTVSGLNDVSSFPDFTYALLQHGYTKDDLAKILGGNFQRVFEEVCNKVVK